MSQVELRMKEAALDLEMLQTMPFTIASIDEFELAAQIVAQTGILPFLGKKADKSYREWAVSPFAMGNFPDEVKNCTRRVFDDEFIQFGEELRPRT
jgi:hypothetical protein